MKRFLASELTVTLYYRPNFTQNSGIPVTLGQILVMCFGCLIMTQGQTPGSFSGLTDLLCAYESSSEKDKIQRGYLTSSNKQDVWSFSRFKTFNFARSIGFDMCTSVINHGEENVTFTLKVNGQN